MGVDGRPSRSSKVRATMELRRVSLQQQSDDDEKDPDHDVSFARGASRRKRARPARNVRIGSSEDDDGHRAEEEDEDPDDVANDPTAFAEYTAPASLRNPRDENSHDESDDHLDMNDNDPLADVAAYLQPSSQLAAGTVVTKSGRLSKPPQLSPVLTPPTRPRRSTSLAHSEMPMTREQRAERRRRRSEGTEDFHYVQEKEIARSRPRARKRNSYRIDDVDDNDMDEDGDLIVKRNDETLATPRQSRTRATRSHVPKMEDHEAPNGHRRVSTRRRSTVNQPDMDQLTYGAKETPLPAANGIQKPRRTRRNQSNYDDRFKHSDGEQEQDGDGDFPSPGTGEDSEDIEERGFEEQEVLAGEHHGEESDSEYARPQRRSQTQRRARKTQPRRTVPAKRKRSSARAERQESSLARETRKSFRPRNERIRPEDFYPDIESSSDASFSSQGAGPSAKRSRPTRAAASRAGDAIAKKLAPVDYLENPMGTMDTGFSLRQPGRYVRRRSRLRPTRPDPYASDGDDAVGPAGHTGGIEPIQVDLNMSWNDVGGLDHHVRALKEMVSLPLMYPEIFEKFNMEAPKGVLFYGPPGTGKTLCARALAASCGGEPEPNSTATEPPRTSNDNEKAGGNTKENPSVAEASKSLPVDAKMGDVVLERPEPDVIMCEVEGEEIKVTNENGPPASAKTEDKSTCIEAAVEGFEAQALATQHEEVIAGRASEVQDRIGFIATGNSQVASLGNQSAPAPPQPVSKPPVKKKPRVSFFMRNGADCLSKWVGEAERQLRMTFEAAKKHQPAIIFFDEIDGLAPVRSSRQDQIHSSIVSTLLGLMDGLDARGKIVVIGATNRVDAIDPALRRPGRFDRELIFTLPNVRARRKILGIHTSKWAPPPCPEVLDSVAKMTVGYCGADLKSLCSESAIRALRRRYPQIYDSADKLLINVDEVNVTTRDFLSAMKEIVPASHRSARTHARPISERLGPVLNAPLQDCISILRRIFPQGLDPEESKSLQPSAGKNQGVVGSVPPKDSLLSSAFMSCSEDDDDDDDLNFDEARAKISNAGRLRPTAKSSRFGKHQTLRPRLLICGIQGLGQTQIGPAILQRCEGCPVHAIDYPSLHADAGARSAEEALMIAFREALRSVPAILYLPHLQLWWESASPSLRTTLVIALKDLPADLPLLVLATAESPLNDLPPEITELFGELLELSPPSEDSRSRMFTPLLEEAQTVPRLSHAAAKHLRFKRRTEVLPKAPPPPSKPPSASEVTQKVQSEDRFIRLLRMEMRAFVEKLLRDRHYKAFWHPVDPNSAPDYYDIIKIPMDISKIAAQIDLGKYPTVLAMVNDFDVMVRNAIQYNPPNTETGAAILRRAHGLIDIVHAWVDNLNPTLVEACNKIISERVTRTQKELVAKGSGSKDSEAAATDANDRTKDSADAALHVKATSNENEKCTSEDVRKRNALPKDQEVSCATDVNGCDIEAAGTLLDPAVNQESISHEPGEQQIGQEPVVPVSPSELTVLRKLVLAVSTGITVDGLEGLYVKCAKVLHEQRRCMNRAEVVRLLTCTVREARDDPAVVGKLVD